jgi:hypothetical protein
LRGNHANLKSKRLSGRAKRQFRAMADEQYCKNCGAPISKEAESPPPEPKGYFPLLRQSGMPTPHDKTTDKHIVAVMATLAALGIIMSVFVVLTADSSNEINKYEGSVLGNAIVTSFSKTGGDVFRGVTTYNGTISSRSGNWTSISSQTYTLMSSKEEADKFFRETVTKKETSEGFVVLNSNETVWRGTQNGRLNCTVKVGYNAKLGNLVVVSANTESINAISPTPISQATPSPSPPPSNPQSVPVNCSQCCPAIDC